MAATRKLQAEIDRCLKKVTEGVETFEDIWQKVHNATNANQKEKYEADLKKEIKKLQRLRDQIKSWITSGEIKDKTTLYDYRKLIETQMERFKVVERETKTKAYSKEGLGAAQKLDPAQREKEEISCWLVTSIDALNLQVDQFESEIESFQVSKKKRLDKDKQDRMEELKNKLEKHRFHIKKLETLLRMLDNMSVEVDKIRRIKDDVEYYVDSSQDPDFNENEYIYDDIIGLDEIEVSGGGLPSSVTTDSNNSNVSAGSPTSITSGTSPIASPGLGVHNHSTDSIECLEKKKKLEDISSKPVKPMAVRAISSSNNTSNASSISNSTSNSSSLLNNSVPLCNNVPNNNLSTSLSNQTTPTSNSKPTLISSTPSKSQQNNSNSSNSMTGINNVSPTGPLHPFNAAMANHVGAAGMAIPAALPQPLPTNFASAAAVSHNQLQQQLQQPLPLHDHLQLHHQHQHQQQQQQQHNQHQHQHQHQLQQHHHPQMQQQMIPPVPAANLTSNTNSVPLKQHGVANVVENGPISQHHLPSSQQHPSHPTPQLSVNLQATSMSVAAGAGAVADSPPASPPPAPPLPLPLPVNQPLTANGPSRQSPPPGVVLQPPAAPSNASALHSLKSIAAEAVERAGLERATAVSPLACANITPLMGVAPLGPEPLQKEHQMQFRRMETAYSHLPHPSDTERMRNYLPRHIYPTPAYYNQVMIQNMDTLDYFQRLTTDTLFFVFYYMEGTKAQYLAAKALKKQSWRFHIKYMMWFQRHEEPKIINEEYEQGTYIYFDYEKWGQRKKEGFTFEYKYLEDRDLN